MIGFSLFETNPPRPDSRILPLPAEAEAFKNDKWYPVFRDSAGTPILTIGKFVGDIVAQNPRVQQRTLNEEKGVRWDNIPFGCGYDDPLYVHDADGTLRLVRTVLTTFGLRARQQSVPSSVNILTEPESGAEIAEHAALRIEPLDDYAGASMDILGERIETGLGPAFKMSIRLTSIPPEDRESTS